MKHYQKYGNCNVPGENTEEFILDRAKWAYEIIGKYIRICRRMLKLLRNWKFNDEDYIAQYRILDDKLCKFGVLLS